MEAVNDCDDALKLDSTLIKLHIRKATALLRLGHFAMVDEAYCRVLEYNLADLLISNQDENDPMAASAVEQLISKAKIEAKVGLKELDKIKDQVKSLISFEGQMNWESVLSSTESILKYSPFYKVALIAKANALCELNKYDEAKSFIENTIYTTPESILSMYKHSEGKFPFPNPVKIMWIENKNLVNTATADIPVIVNAILCMGTDFAKIYIISLKNQNINKSCSGSVIEKVLDLLGDIHKLLSAEDNKERWSWIRNEFEKVQSLSDFKQSADQQFKTNSFKAAVHNYGNALKV